MEWGRDGGVRGGGGGGGGPDLLGIGVDIVLLASGGMKRNITL